MFAAIAMVMGLVCVGLVIDLGRFYYLKSDLQRIANLAALDAARVSGGCVGNVSNRLTSANSEASSSVVRNGGNAAWLVNGVRIGARSGNGGVRYFDNLSDPKNRAVEVKLTRPMPGRLIPLLADSAGAPATFSATASAYSSPSAMVKMGTQVVSVNTAGASNLNKLFTGLLGAPVNLDVLTYNAFLNAQVPVRGLLDRVNIGPGGDPATPISQRTLLGALVDTLTAQGATLAANAARALYNVASTSKTVLPSQVLGINNPTSDAVLTAADIAMAASQLVANGTVSNLPVGLPAPLNGILQLSLVQPGSPTFLVPGGIDLFSENFAANTQALARTTATVTLPLNLGLANVNVNLNLPLYVQAGKGTAEIDHIDCPRRSQTQKLAYVRAQTGIVNVGIGNFANPSSPNASADWATVIDTEITVPLTVLLTTVPVRIHVRADARATIALASANSVMAQSFTEGQTRHLGTPRITQVTGAVSPTSIEVRTYPPTVVFTLPLVSTLLNTVLSILNPTLETLIKSAVVQQLSALADGAVLPLLDQAGVTVGGADVTVTHIEADQPTLFTH